MKRLILILSIILISLFSSCGLKRQDYIAVQVIQNGFALKPHYDTSKLNYYFNIDSKKEFWCYYFIIPLTDKPIGKIDLQYDNQILSLVSQEDDIITFEPIAKGSTYVFINTAKYGNTSTYELRIQ